ncbi:DUF899 family protein [Nonomuraea sp. CA-218870]|uniref:DUF899 family protein n=1 Tax=Nonomuraea sp. CA-218870 TaxID=3239998 RepID=UPI003D931D0C
MFTDNVGHLAHLHARDVSMALVSTGPLAEIMPSKRRMGWDHPVVRGAGRRLQPGHGTRATGSR